ncbi:ProQ/FINO family protein [Marinospirillum celere]|uniref:ProQ/FINO family protein n=1 Tax=Marinospirillum celere TaxID=1122252 RepID=A0A1I1IYI5_9GAMM|nr:ProQ/FINO family protein [Marinospirillum celere]SFC39438.1 ProQ/FINO family protein [Marinospirillum celere]
MALEQKVDDLFDQLTSYADQGLGALGRAQQEIHALKERNLELESRVEELEGKLNQLKEKINTQLQGPEAESLLSRPDALMMLIRETLGLKAPEAQKVPEEGFANLEAMNPQQRLEHWVSKYPRAFMPGQPQPLKIGIHEDLLAAEGGDQKKIRRALAGYVKLPRYLRCLKAGAVRLDLQGSNAGFVTEQEAEFAREQLELWETQKKQKEHQRRKQEEEQKKRAEEDRLSSKLQQLMQLNTR